jgi:hypothetical protein
VKWSRIEVHILVAIFEVVPGDTVIEFLFLSQEVGSLCKGFSNELVTVGFSELFGVFIVSFL